MTEDSPGFTMPGEQPVIVTTITVAVPNDEKAIAQIETMAQRLLREAKGYSSPADRIEVVPCEPTTT